MDNKSTMSKMQDSLILSVRQIMKDKIKLLPNENQVFFKRMYSHKNLDKPIDLVIDDMEENKLEWALSQIETTLNKIQKQK